MSQKVYPERPFEFRLSKYWLQKNWIQKYWLQKQVTKNYQLVITFYEKL